jgi:deoxyribonuclease V
MRERVVSEDAFGRIETVAGVDAAIRHGHVIAACAVLAFPALAPLESVIAVRPLEFPYVPGLLAFREMPAIRAAFAKLETHPDLVFVDGHGRAHPRRFGIACMLGVELDVPAIGIGKSRLIGTHREPGTRKGSHTRLMQGDEVIGSCLRTRDGVRPLYVSVGHRVSLETAVRLTLRCCRRYRLPEPIREAHMRAGTAASRVPSAP